MEGYFFHGKELSKTKEYYYLEAGFSPSITNIVESMNSLIQNRNNHNTTCISVKVDRRTQKVESLLVSYESCLVITSIELAHIFGGDFRNDREILMFGRGPHKPLFAYDIVRILSLMIHTDIVEYIKVGDTKSFLITMLSFHIKGNVR